MAMEGERFSGDIFIQDFFDRNEKADNLNDETFGSCDEYMKGNGDWQRRHAEISRLIAIDAKRFRDADVAFPSPHRGNLLGKLLGKNTFDNQCNENIIHKLIRGDKFEKRVSSSLPSTPTSARTPKSRTPSVIRVEDLERELVRDRSKSPALQIQTPPPTIIKRRPNSSNRHAPFPMISPKELRMQHLFNGVHHSPRMPPFSMVNQRLDFGNYHPLIERGVPLSPPVLRPYLNPVVFGKTAFYQQLNQQQQKRTPSRSHFNDSGGKHQKQDWPKVLHPEKFKDIDYEEFIEMEPSKMMNVKEKKWIFKIGLMNLLVGDPYVNDYYFISLFTKKMLDESEIKTEDKDIRKNLVKTNQLVNHAQQTKEGHRPVKFKGSLGKLSITSVHHPRKVMDVSVPELEPKHSHPVDETDQQRKLVTYGAVEKMYSMLLSIMDMDREFEKSKEEDRSEKINELFDMFQIGRRDSPNGNDRNHFGDLMSIYKGRKLFIRIFLMFSQEQSESLFIALIRILPSLLITDTEQCLIQFNEKLAKMLMNSNANFKAKCIELLREIDLNIILAYSASILMLSTILGSLEKKNVSVNLNCLYYVETVPKTLLTITDDISHLKPQLTDLMVVLGLIKSHDQNATC